MCYNIVFIKQYSTTQSSYCLKDHYNILSKKKTKENGKHAFTEEQIKLKVT